MRKILQFDKWFEKFFKYNMLLIDDKRKVLKLLSPNLVNFVYAFKQRLCRYEYNDRHFSGFPDQLILISLRKWCKKKTLTWVRLYYNFDIATNKGHNVLANIFEVCLLYYQCIILGLDKPNPMGIKNMPMMHLVCL